MNKTSVHANNFQISDAYYEHFAVIHKFCLNDTFTNTSGVLFKHVLYCCGYEVTVNNTYESKVEKENTQNLFER